MIYLNRQPGFQRGPRTEQVRHKVCHRREVLLPSGSQRRLSPPSWGKRLTRRQSALVSLAMDAARLRWRETKLGFRMREYQYLETERNRRRDFTGSLDRISFNTSSGSSSSIAMLIRRRMLEPWIVCLAVPWTQFWCTDILQRYRPFGRVPAFFSFFGCDSNMKETQKDYRNRPICGTRWEKKMHAKK